MISICHTSFWPPKPAYPGVSGRVGVDRERVCSAEAPRGDAQRVVVLDGDGDVRGGGTRDVLDELARLRSELDDARAAADGERAFPRDFVRPF